MNFNHFIPTRIVFGKGQLASLHKQDLPGRKALIVISSARPRGVTAISGA